MALDTDVIVIGAGPIGLINAWGMKKLNPNLKLVVLEKYSEYQRSHTLVMQAAQLKAIMKATHSESDPEMVSLLEQLQNDPHIRTNSLQQLFTRLAKESGIEIKTQVEVKPETLKQTLSQEYPNARLIIGADGTHSVVSETLFSKNNQVKHEFDFVLQLRFEINGEEKTSAISTANFYQQMARHGIIANEYVGHFDQGKTPVTMQMMISKEDFLALQQYTSKNPLTILNSYNEENRFKLPVHLRSFITTYLKYKIHGTHETNQTIENESVRVSVNEAPATHAKEVVTTYQQARVALEGDAALGLSYFKGLNAGLEASARFLTGMSAAIKNGFRDTSQTDRALAEYQNWFLKDFSPKKVKEVGRYSFWQIRSFMKAINFARGVKNLSSAEYAQDLGSELTDYFRHVALDPLARNVDSQWRIYPHREYDPIQFGEFSYVPLKHTAKKIAKLFIDYFKPYKSNEQVLQDFKQPMMGLGNFGIGFGKVGFGFVMLNIKLIADGLLTLARGLIELYTYPLAWVVKPITRYIATLIHGGYKKIEENKGLPRLAQYGQEYLAATDEQGLTSNQTMYELLAVCNDIHRKFEKSLSKGQSTDLAMEEHAAYSNVRSDNVLDRVKLSQYFSLFATKTQQAEIVPENQALTTKSFV